MTLSSLLSILSLSGCCSSSACLQIQVLAKIPLLLTLAPLRTNLTSRLPIQEAFPGTNPTPTLQHPTKPQGLKCQEREGLRGHGQRRTVIFSPSGSLQPLSCSACPTVNLTLLVTHKLPGQELLHSPALHLLIRCSETGMLNKASAKGNGCEHEVPSMSFFTGSPRCQRLSVPPLQATG